MEREAAQFLRSLRGSRSQRQLSRRLGYRGNPITDWERAVRFPTIHETLRALTLGGVDVPAAFARFAPTVSVPVGPRGERLSDWLGALRAATRFSELAGRCQRSRFAVRRWVLGRAKPRLPDFMRLLDALTARLPEWCAGLVALEQIPLLERRHRATLAAKRLAFDAPWTEAVLRLLETTAYRSLKRHRPGFIAEILGFDLATERLCLEQLTASGLIERRARRFVVAQQNTVDTQGGKAALHQLKRHWASVAMARLGQPTPAELFAYNVMSLSRSDSERVRRKLQETFREIRTLVAASSPEEVVAVCNLQLMLWDPDAGSCSK